jgi:hypothetical protein
MGQCAAAVEQARSVARGWSGDSWALFYAGVQMGRCRADEDAIQAFEKSLAVDDATHKSLGYYRYGVQWSCLSLLYDISKRQGDRDGMTHWLKQIQSLLKDSYAQTFARKHLAELSSR